MKIFLWVVIFLLSAGVIADDAVSSTKWRLSGGAREVFDTPLGAVYRIESGEPHALIRNADKKDSRIPLMGGLLYTSFLKDNERTKRIVVAEFKIRAYPALEKKEGPDFSFVLAFSENSEMQNDYRSLNGLMHVSEWGGAFPLSNYFPDATRMITYRGIRLRPDFEPVAIRIAFDTVTGELFSSHNGNNRVFTSANGMAKWPKENAFVSTISGALNKTPGSPIRVRSLGIVTMKAMDGGRNQYLEISPPTVRLFDKMEEVIELTPLQFSLYPYGSYAPDAKKAAHNSAELVKNAKRDKNPEVQYAAALKLLYGGENFCDPEAAVKLLEDAARDSHVLALYQLGVCYYRGYGVEPDLKKALKYLGDAVDFNYQNAQALEWFVRWEMARRPFFMIEDLLKKFDEIKIKSPYEHDFRHLRKVVGYFGAGGVPYSIKDVVFEEYMWMTRLKGDETFADYAISTGYFPAYAAKARPSLVKLDDNERLELLEKGVRAGDVSAVPDLLFVKARLNKLLPDDFTAERDIIFAENAQYLFLAYASRNPDLPGIKEFIQQNQRDADRFLRGTNSPDKHILAALMTLARWLPPKTVLAPVRRDDMATRETFERNEHEIAKAMENLLRAAEADNPTAQYLLSYLYFRNDLPTAGVNLTGFDPQRTLMRAAAQGHIKALMLLAEQELNHNNNIEKALQYLELPCKTNYAPALYLKGQVLYNSNPRRREAKQTFLRAAQLGDHRGRQSLALLFPSGPDKKRKYWYEFIRADLKSRSLDYFDPYYPVLYQDLYSWKRKETTRITQDLEAQSWLDRKNEIIKEYRKKH